MKKNQFKFLSIIFCFILIFTSCTLSSTSGGGNTTFGSPGTGSNTAGSILGDVNSFAQYDPDELLSPITNKTCNQPNGSFNFGGSEKFSIKNTNKKPNEHQRIKVLKKSFSNPVKLKENFKYPLNHEVDFKGFNSTSMVLNIKKHIPLSIEEIKKKRKQFWKEWYKKRKEQYKENKKDLKDEHKKERITEKEKFKEELKNYKKGSPEYKALIQEQIEAREELLADQKENRQALKNEYKKDIEEFKSLLNIIYPKQEDKSFSTKALTSPCDPNDPYCDPFSGMDTGSLEDDSTEYYYIDPFDSANFEVDDTYTNGNPYDSSTQAQQPQITNSLDDFPISNEEVEKLELNGFKLEGCPEVGDIQVYKSGDSVSYIFNGSNEACNIKSMEIKNVSTYNYQQSSTSEIEVPNSSFKLEVDMGYSGKGGTPSKTEVYLVITKNDGKTETIKVGEFSKPAAGTFTIKDIPEIQNQITFISPYTFEFFTTVFPTSTSIEVRQKNVDAIVSKYYEKFTLGIQNLSAISPTLKIKNEDTGKYHFVSTNFILNGMTRDISIKRENLETGNYVYEIWGKPTDGSEQILASKKVTFTRPLVTTFATEAKYSGYSETAFVPKSGELNKLEPKSVYLNQIPVNISEDPINRVNIPLLINSCDVNRNKNILKDLSRIEDINNNLYVSYIMSKALTKSDNNSGFEKTYQSEILNCSNNYITVGGVVDLTNPDPIINKKLYDQKTFVKLSLEVEDYNCNTLKSWTFPARMGTRHVVTQKLLSEYLKNACNNKVYYVKIKNSFDKISDPDSSQSTYINTSDNDNPINKQYDSFPYIINLSNQMSTTPPQNDSVSFNGTKIVIKRCPSELCAGDFKNISDQLIKQPEPQFDNSTEFVAGDKVKVYPEGYNYTSPPEDIAVNPTFTTKGIEEEVVLTKSEADKLNEQIEQIYNDIYSKNTLINASNTSIQNLKQIEEDIETFREELAKNYITINNKYEPITTNRLTNKNLLIQKANIIESNLIKLEKYTKEQFLTLQNSKQVQAISNYKVLSRYLSIYNRIQSTAENIRKLKDAYKEDRQNVLSARRNYSSTNERVSEKLRKTNKDECKKYAKKEELRRIRRYLVNFIINDLSNAINIYESSSSVELDSNKTLTALTDSLADVNARVVHADNRLDTICKEPPLECKPEDFQTQPADNYFITQAGAKTIKCRVCYQSASDTTANKIRAELQKLKSSLTITNTIHKAYDEDPVTNTFGFAVALNETKNTVEGFYNSSSQFGGDKVKNLVSTLTKQTPFSIQPVSEWIFAPSFASLKNENQKYQYYYRDLALSYNSLAPNHSEPKLMESVAKRYCNNVNGKITCDKVKVFIFTDRETCSNCQKFFEAINLGLSSTGYRITVDGGLQGIYKTGSITEYIPFLPTSFINNYQDFQCPVN